MSVHKYAFDIKMYAVVRVTATSEQKAREALDQCLSCMDLSEHTVDGINDTLARDLCITEASLTTEDGAPELFELDGVEL